LRRNYTRHAFKIRAGIYSTSQQMHRSWRLSIWTFNL